jgi:hypothetical protein
VLILPPMQAVVHLPSRARRARADWVLDEVQRGRPVLCRLHRSYSCPRGGPQRVGPVLARAPYTRQPGHIILARELPSPHTAPCSLFAGAPSRDSGTIFADYRRGRFGEQTARDRRRAARTAARGVERDGDGSAGVAVAATAFLRDGYVPSLRSAEHRRSAAKPDSMTIARRQQTSAAGLPTREPGFVSCISSFGCVHIMHGHQACEMPKAPWQRTLPRAQE